MASNTAELKIRIQADLANAKTELEAINKEIANIDPKAQVAAQSLREMDKSTSSLSGVVMGAATAFLSLQTAMAAIRISDDYNQMASRLKMATTSAAEYELVQRKIMETADRTYKPLAEQQELFIRSSSAMREMGYSTDETLKFLDSVSSTLTINSADTEKFKRANDALSKSMVTGKLSGNEWQAVMETMPTAIKDIADYMGETETAVKQMAAEGKLSMGQFVDAMNAVQAKNAELAENMPTTLGDAMTKLKNHVSAYLGEANNSIGVSEKLVEAVNFVTEHIDTLAKAFTALVAGGLARYGVVLVQNTIATLKAVTTKNALIAQEVALAQAQVATTRAALLEANGHSQAAAAAAAHQAALARLATAQKAVSTGILGLGLPGLVMTVATAAAGLLLFSDNTNTATEALDKFGSSTDEANQKIKAMTTEQAANGMLALTKEIKKQTEELDNAKTKAIDYLEYLNNFTYKAEAQGIMTPDRATELQEVFYKIRTAMEDGGKGAEVQIQKLEKLSPGYKEAADLLRKYAAETANQASELNKLNDIYDVYKSRVDGDTQATDNANKAHRDFISAASTLDAEIKKLTTSTDGNIKSAATMTEVIAGLEANINNLKNTAGATPEKINELSAALDKLKANKQALDNINNQKFIDNLKTQNATAGMSNWDKQRYTVNNNPTFTDDKRKEALAVINQGEAQEKSTKAAEKAKSASESLTKANISYVEGLEKNVATMNLGKIATLEYELSQKKLSGALLERAKASLEALQAAQQLANIKTNSSMQIELLRLNGNSYQADLLALENKFKESTENLKKEGNETGIALAKELFDAGKVKLQLDKVKAEIDKAFSNQSQQEQSIQAQVQAGLITQYQGQKRLTELHAQTAATVEKYLPELEKAAQMPGAMGAQSKAYLTEVNNQLLILKATTSELENAFRNGLQDGIQTSIDGLVRGTMDLQDALKSFVDSIASNILNVITQNIAQQATSGIMSGLSSLDAMVGLGSPLTTNDPTQATPQAAAISTASQEGAFAMQTGIEQGGIAAAQAISSAISGMNAVNGGLGGGAGLFGNVTQQATEAVGAINTVKATKTAADAALTASAATSAATTQATTTAAASSAQTAWAPAAASAATASFGTAAMIGLSALMMVMTAIKAFATGGHVKGAGTGTSDSIPAMLSNDEFVTRSAVVRQPGMLAFMKDLNNRGWGAIDDVARVRHATGGLAGSPAPNNFSAPNAPSAPSISAMGGVENINNNQTSLENNQHFYFVDDPKKIANSIANNSNTQEAIFVYMQNNHQQFKTIFSS